MWFHHFREVGGRKCLISDSRSAIILFRLAAALVVIMIALGAVWYGVSGEVWHRIWTDLLARPGGPMTFRFILQPAMAAVAALYDGIKDARLGRSPYFWTIMHDAHAVPAACTRA